MESGKTTFNTELNIQKIQLAQEKILENHIEFKVMFKDIFKLIKEEEKDRIKSDAEIMNKCKDGFSQLYKNVAYYGVGLIITMVSGIIGYIAYKI